MDEYRRFYAREALLEDETLTVDLKDAPAQALVTWAAAAADSLEARILGGEFPSPEEALAEKLDALRAFTRRAASLAARGAGEPDWADLLAQAGAFLPFAFFNADTLAVLSRELGVAGSPDRAVMLLTGALTIKAPGRPKPPARTRNPGVKRPKGAWME